MKSLKKIIGITSTIPVEVIYAAGHRAFDLNNLFFSDAQPQQLIEQAEREGLPRNCCTWVKGIYSVIQKQKLDMIVGVVQGDCTPLVTMLETLLPTGIEFYPFAYPYTKSRETLRIEIQKMMTLLGVQWDEVEKMRDQLNEVRALAHKIDYMTWHDGVITSEDNLNVLINCTDFMGDPDRFKQQLLTMINQAAPLPKLPKLRLGLLGIPGVFTDLYDYLETKETGIVYHEVARQFAMPNYKNDLLDQYLTYTYPYSIENRLEDIEKQSELRQLDGYIHYVQTFCHHQIEDTAFKKKLNKPVLTLEGDRVGRLDGRTKTRIDAFLEMLTHKKRK